MKWIFHEREARVKYSLTTDRQPVIYWTTNHLLARICLDSNTHTHTHTHTHTRKRRKGKCILRMFPVFRHYMKRNTAKTLSVIVEFTCISSVLMRENDVTPSNLMEMKFVVIKQIKMTSR